MSNGWHTSTSYGGVGNQQGFVRHAMNVNRQNQQRGGGWYRPPRGIGSFRTPGGQGPGGTLSRGQMPLDMGSMFQEPQWTGDPRKDTYLARMYNKANQQNRFMNTMRANYMGGEAAQGRLSQAQRAAMAGMNYDLKTGSRGDFQNLTTRGGGGFMGAGTGVTSGGSAGFSPEMATMGQSRRARELTGLQERFGMARAGIDERMWGRLGGTLENASNRVNRPNYGYPSRGGGGRGFNLMGGQNTALGRMLMSDARLKKDIQKIGELTSGLSIYTWEWNDKANEIGVADSPTYGVVAQEAAKLYPDAVTEGEDGYLRVDYSTGVLGELWNQGAQSLPM